MMNGLQRKKISSFRLIFVGLKIMNYLMLMSLKLCHPKTKRLKRHETIRFLHTPTKENMMNLQILKILSYKFC